MLGLITLDNGEDHTKPNTFGPRACSSLNTAIDAALADDEITAIGVTGKPFILAAGADLTAIAGGGPRRRTHRSPSSGTRSSASCSDGGKPSFGFVNGLALGGGLEVALHCTYRTVMDSRAGPRPARGHARPGPRLGRRLPGAQPGRCRQGRDS